MKAHIIKLIVLGLFVTGPMGWAEDGEQSESHSVAEAQESAGGHVPNAEAEQNRTDMQKKGMANIWNLCKKRPALDWEGAARYLTKQLMRPNISPEQEQQVAGSLLQTLYVAERSNNTPKKDSALINALFGGVKGVLNAENPEQRTDAIKTMAAIQQMWDGGGFHPQPKPVKKEDAKRFIEEVGKILALQKKGYAIALDKEAVKDMKGYIEEFFPELLEKDSPLGPVEGSID